MNKKIGEGWAKPALMPDEIEAQKQQPFLRWELTGHLWNDWAGKGQELCYVIEPARRGRGKEKITRG